MASVTHCMTGSTGRLLKFFFIHTSHETMEETDSDTEGEEDSETSWRERIGEAVLYAIDLVVDLF